MTNKEAREELKYIKESFAQNALSYEALDLADTALKVMELLMDGNIPYTIMQEWIPVSESLPEEEEIVLITIDSSCYPRPFVDMGFYKVKTKKWYWFNGENINHSIKVTSWMSLPQPYKAESEDAE